MINRIMFHDKVICKIRKSFVQKSLIKLGDDSKLE